jgi:molybdate transport repressor ModE-like protein
MPDRRIHISPRWSFSDGTGNELDPVLFTLLDAINQTGKLTKAAEIADISYRHAWNLLNKSADFLGAKLVKLEKGRGAKLTALGEKVRWAEQRVAARLLPQMQSLASELNIEIQRELAEIAPILRLHASYGYAVALLPEFAEGFQLDLQYKSATDALISLSRGSCDIAGIHIPAQIRIDSLIQRYARHLKPRVHRVIRFITRQQGLMIKPGNPKRITGIQDLVRDDIRFINRREDSGTRALLDKLLRDANIDTNAVNGFAEEEFTHSAVAAFVAAGMADAGFGVEAAASQFGLDFIPITTEHYLMLCHEKSLTQPAVVKFMAAISSELFQQKVTELAGYHPAHCGEIEPLTKSLL